MGEARRRKERGGKPLAMVTDTEAQAKFDADVKRRREEAYVVDNFLLDGDTGLVFFSASKTQGGIVLPKEITLCTSLHGFATMIATFVQMSFPPPGMSAVMVPPGGRGDGKPN